MDPRHIPIGGSTFWDYDRLLLDFVPGPNGTEGQLIQRVGIHSMYLCGTFRELVDKTALGLEDGSIVAVDKGEGFDGAIELQYRSSSTQKPISAAEYFA
jgi:hypothetical protein